LPPGYYWWPEPLFEGRTVFVIGGGPSLDDLDLEPLRDRATIAVNSAGPLLAPWALLFFRDLRWFFDHRKIVETWPGHVITTNTAAKRQADRLRLVRTTHFGEFPPADSGLLRHGRTSGHIAVALAVAMRARRIVLLGFDCRMVDGRSHFHDEYKGHEMLYSADFLPAWKGWGAAAQKAGVEIINATPDSAVAEFPRAELQALLGPDSAEEAEA
jgi:hypothetical protein